MKPRWTMDWAEVQDDARYVVCPVYKSTLSGRLMLSQPVGLYKGWEVKRHLEGCYAALPCPEFNPQDSKETNVEPAASNLMP